MSRATLHQRLLSLLAASCAAFLALLLMLRAVAAGAQVEPDVAPAISESYPTSGVSGVPLTSTLAITFTEAVTLSRTALHLHCSGDGDVPLTLAGGPSSYRLQPESALEHGQHCHLAIAGSGVSDHDAVDPPDQMAEDWQIDFRLATADYVLINELDAVTPLDDAEFIELYDGGRGSVSLDGLTLALLSSHNNSVYASFDLSGMQTDANGYFLLGNRHFAEADIELDDSILQNGPDAVALYRRPAADLPVGTAVTTVDLLDALVYHSGQLVSPELLGLLQEGEAAADENGRDLADFDSLQRCPNGSGGQRRSTTVQAYLPSPDTLNVCNDDQRPRVMNTTPADAQRDVPRQSELTITFSEDVALGADSVEVVCTRSGEHQLALQVQGAQASVTPLTSFAFGETCQARIAADQVRDLDEADPPDFLAEEYAWSFTIAPARHLLINEVDADTPGADAAEFIELYDGGAGQTSLDGLLLVFFNGANDLSYRTVDLAGKRTNAQGRFVVGNAAVPNVDLLLPDGTLQNGPDAVALYAATAADFPHGTAVATHGLLDAVVYGPAAEPDPGLLPLLLVGEGSLDEDSRDNEEGDSQQRCPDGHGERRSSIPFVQNLATPGQANKCTFDAAPTVAGSEPVDGAVNVSRDISLTLTFSERVTLQDGWAELHCDKGGVKVLNSTLDGNRVTLTPQEEFLAHDACLLTVQGARIRDNDIDDPPDKMVSDFTLSFTTTGPPLASHVLINEVDADTPGADAAEFIELYDGGAGQTSLDGLLLVFFNGANDLSYRTIDLAGKRTNAQGRFVVGNAAVPNIDLLLPDGTLQNGPDAVALYAATAADFPHGTVVTANGLLDAVVYGPASEPDSGLLPLLLSADGSLDENSRGNAAGDSNQRCPDGGGDQRRSASFVRNWATPGEANRCIFDAAPAIVSTTPAAGAGDVPREATITLEFSEAVDLQEGWHTFVCEKEGPIALSAKLEGQQVLLAPGESLPPADVCALTVRGDRVHDADADDPPDEMAGDFLLSFRTAAPPVAKHMLINEIDADTLGVDRAEFIELYDGGTGNTALDGLLLVLVNGRDDAAYRRIDLAGWATDASGYFVAGGTDLPQADMIISAGAIQNGPDAVALYDGASYSEDAHGLPATGGLLDAVVYHSDDEPDAGLDFLLLPGEVQLNESRWRDAAFDSLQRCPNAAGGQRRTGAFVSNRPTPGAPSDCLVDTPPQIVGVTPGDGSAGVPPDNAITVEFDEAVEVEEGWITVACEQAGRLAFQVGGGPRDYVIEPLGMAPFDLCLARVDGDKVHDLDGYRDQLGDDYGWEFGTGKPSLGACGDPATPLHLLQGDGAKSPLEAERGTVVEGLVVGDFRGAEALGGFFLQEERMDWDADPLTSEAIFVPDGAIPLQMQSGALLRLQGDVAEVSGMTSLVNLVEWQQCASSRPLEPLPISLPVTEAHNWEAVEGMLLTFTQTLTVTGSERWASEGVVELSPQRLYVPTEVAQPGEAARAVAALNQRSRIALDDGLLVLFPKPLPPYVGAGGTLRLGDTLHSVSGVLAEIDGELRLQPVQAVAFDRTNPRPVLPARAPGRTRVAHLNSGGFFNGDGHGGGFPSWGPGAHSYAEYLRQRAKLAEAILALDAAIVGLTAVELDGFGPESALTDLLAAVNDAAPPDHLYQVIEVDQPRNMYADGAALLYRADLVTPDGPPLVVGGAPFDGRVQSPIGQHFVVGHSGERLTMLVAQFPGREECPAPGDPNADLGDGQACWNPLRAEAAIALADWIAAYQAESVHEVLLTGDLNSLRYEQPAQALQLGGLLRLPLAGEQADAYSAVFDGEAALPNPAFATPGLIAKVAHASPWHINADEPQALDYRLHNQAGLYQPGFYRSAAGDPLVIDLAAAALEAAFTSSADALVGRPVAFTNASHGPRPLAFSWDFGDGSAPSADENPLHVYLAVGTYTVTLTVRTSWGEASVASATVRVSPRSVFLPALPSP